MVLFHIFPTKNNKKSNTKKSDAKTSDNKKNSSKKTVRFNTTDQILNNGVSKKIYSDKSVNNKNKIDLSVANR